VLTVTTHGWRQGGDVGPPWVPNVLVEVDLPSLRLGGTWLVAGVRLARTIEEGTTCELALARPDAYLPQPPDPELEPDLSGEDDA
jgi:prophage tail gpP-like protein